MLPTSATDPWRLYNQLSSGDYDTADLPVLNRFVQSSGGRRVIPGLYRDYNRIYQNLREDVRRDGNEAAWKYGNLGRYLWINWPESERVLGRLRDARDKALEDDDQERLIRISDAMLQVQRAAVQGAMEARKKPLPRPAPRDN
jgi:hypothetical protein